MEISQDRYDSHTQIENILKRPDTYVGSIEPEEYTTYIIDDEGALSKKTVSICPALINTIREVINNAVDHAIEFEEVTRIDISIVGGEVSVKNNGPGIPHTIHAKTGVHVPQMVFGTLLASSNYNDNKRRFGTGRNGYGAKLQNIYSEKFSIECQTSGQVYRQTWTNNMSSVTNPSMRQKKGNDYTKVSFKLDHSKYGCEVDSDHVGVLRYLVYAASSVTRPRFTFNGVTVPIKKFKDLLSMHDVDKSFYIHGEHWDVAIQATPDKLDDISYVNTLFTSDGGTHLNYIRSKVKAGIKKYLTGAMKKLSFDDNVRIVVSAFISNPSFSSQTKSMLKTPSKKFDTSCDLTDAFFSKFVKKSGIQEILSAKMNRVETKLAKKTDGKKTSRITGLPKLVDANFAGTRKSSDCYLLLTEGDSAQAGAVAGISQIGNDYWGAFPIKGKFINAFKTKKLQANKEYMALKKILGLKEGVKYTDTSQLRYGHVIPFTDQDTDGFHIKGLVMSLFLSEYPELFSLPGFIMFFITPVAKCTLRNQSKSFYNMIECTEFIENNPQWTVSYYKGLGTSTPKEMKEYFANVSEHLIHVDHDQHADELMKTVFDNSPAIMKKRKRWINKEVESTVDFSSRRITVSDFINKELHLYALDTLTRALPNVIDSFKDGQRKIMFTFFEKIKSTIVVEAASGIVASTTNYHHGQNSLMDTITNLAQDYVGSNNLNLLEPKGQFGDRSTNGKNACAGRYTKTFVRDIAKLIYRKEDECILEYGFEEGIRCEPKYYIPIIPMILINGCNGIAFGWSTTILPHNPLEIIDWLMDAIKSNFTIAYPTLHPWYRGFTGKVNELKENSYELVGNVVREGPLYTITEIPPGVATDDVCEALDGLDHVVYCEKKSESSVQLKVTKQLTDKQLKIVKLVNSNNMHAFNEKGVVNNYSSTRDILSNFVKVRLGAYQKRKVKMIELMKIEQLELLQKVRFIDLILSGTLETKNRPKCDILSDLERHGLDEKFMKMTQWATTKERVQELHDKCSQIDEEIRSLELKHIHEIWLQELSELRKKLL